MDNRTFLATPGKDAIVALLRESFLSDPSKLAILDNWSDYTIDPVHSTLTQDARLVGKDGTFGLYQGETFYGSVQYNYNKRDLEALLPYPLVYPIEYPTSFGRLSSYFASQYGIVLEDKEFAIGYGETHQVLSGNDVMAFPLDPSTGCLSLQATPQSIRFIEGSILQVYVAVEGGAFALERLLRSEDPLDFRLLTDHPTIFHSGSPS